jgi:hypothetical protein
MDNEPLRHFSMEPSMVFYLAKYWPGLAAVGGLLLGGYGFLAGNGFIDGVVHVTQFNMFKAHVEEHEKGDAERHMEIKSVVSEVRSDTKLLLQEQIKLGRVIERMEARGNSTPIAPHQ